MITPDQAVEAAFYTGANLLSFTDERAANLDWMGCRRDDLAACKTLAARTVRELTGGGAAIEISTIASILVSSLGQHIMIEPNALTRAQRASYFCFVSVLLAVDGLVRREAEEAALAARAAMPAPIAAAYGEEDEDRIDALAPDPFERVSGARDWGAPSLAPAPSKKKGK